MDLETSMPSVSPSKGKVVDPNQGSWKSGWWDFYPLLESPKRPLEWSSSSVIFTAHPTQPLITGRHFSSSKQFLVPSPGPVLAAPASYHPPTVISLHPTDQWLFAFYPRKDGEGTGCLWKHGLHIDSWTIKESWTFSKGGDVVAASWLTGRREWIVDASKNPVRLPPRGPPTPFTDPTLVCVTQDQVIHVCYLRHYMTGLRTIKRSLGLPGMTPEQTHPTQDILDSVAGTRQCLQAAIGIGYNDLSIFVATHSRRMPPPPAISAPPFNSMDLSVSLDLSQLSASENVSEWNTWSEDRTIELFEAQLRFDGVSMALLVTVMPPLECPNNSLTDLNFICMPPERTVAPSESPNATSLSVPPFQKNRGKFCLAVSQLHINDYAKAPTSQLLLYSFTPKVVANRPGWNIRLDHTRTFETKVLASIKAFTNLSKPIGMSLFACLLDTSGIFPHPPQKTTSIGGTFVLNVPDLNDDPNWEPAPIRCPVKDAGREPPLFFALSPNTSLLCSLTASVAHSHRSIFHFPRASERHKLSSSLVEAVLNRSSASDVVHLLSSPDTSMDQIVETLFITSKILETHTPEPRFSHARDILGLAIEIYRQKHLSLKPTEDKDLLAARWQTAQDICSLVACNLAFNDCQNGSTYDLESAWDMIAMLTWVVRFTEGLMKKCVLFSCSNIDGPNVAPIDVQPSDPSLLLLSHPYALEHLCASLNHVKNFRAFVGSRPAGGESARVAKDVLVDTVDCSGVDVPQLLTLLTQNRDKLENVDRDDCHRALAACEPTIAIKPFLIQVTQEITDSASVLNKPVLFINPDDLVDGIARLTITQPKKEDKDVVTKGLLPEDKGKHTACLRCGGIAGFQLDPPNPTLPTRWKAWERMWHFRCICGGPWFSIPHGH